MIPSDLSFFTMIRNLLFLTLIVSACNSQETTKIPAVTADKHQSALSLNNGVKWRSDENTRRHVANLSSRINGFNKLSDPQINDYHALASNMQDELNGLVKECRMKGAEHEALHHWLEPVLQHVKELKEAGSVKDARETLGQLAVQVQKFNQYFN